jgi:hypothetical protein
MLANKGSEGHFEIDFFYHPLLGWGKLLTMILGVLLSPFNFSVIFLFWT